MLRRRLWICLLSLLIPSAVECRAQSISSISGNKVTIDAGAAAGVKPGSTAYVVTTEESGGKRMQLRIAKLLVTSVAQNSSAGVLSEVSNGFKVAAGMRIRFQPSLTVAPPSVLQTSESQRSAATKPRSDVATPQSRKLDRPKEPDVQAMSVMEKLRYADSLAAEMKFDKSLAVIALVESEAPDPILYAERKERITAQKKAHEEHLKRRDQDLALLEDAKKNFDMYRELVGAYEKTDPEKALGYQSRVLLVDKSDAEMARLKKLESQVSEIPKVKQVFESMMREGRFSEAAQVLAQSRSAGVVVPELERKLKTIAIEAWHFHNREPHCFGQLHISAEGIRFDSSTGHKFLAVQGDIYSVYAIPMYARVVCFRARPVDEPYCFFTTYSDKYSDQNYFKRHAGWILGLPAETNTPR